MPTTKDYINSLKRDKENLITNLGNLGMKVSASDNFSTLATKTGTFVPEPNLQSKDIEITENGDTTVTPDEGYQGLSQVNVTTNVEGGGGEPIFTGHYDTNGLKAIGYDDDTIEWYQKKGVTWNSDVDSVFVLTDNDKSYFGLTETDILQLTSSNNKKQYLIAYIPMFNITKTSLNYAFYQYRMIKTIPKFDTSKVTTMNSMFSNCQSLITIPQLNMSNVTSVSNMFNQCQSLKTIPLLDTSKVTDMSYMFQNCYSLNAIPNLVTNLVKNISYMFSNCYSLKTIPLLNTSSVTNVDSMFSGCYSLVSIPKLNTNLVTTFYRMFYNCYSLKEVPKLNANSVTNINSMFYNCYGLKKVAFENFNKVTNAADCFYNCYVLEEIDLSDADLDKITGFGTMFGQCGSKLPSGQLTKVYVKDADAQNWVLTKSNGHPSTWSTANVIIAGSAEDLRGV